ncbi:MAG TPA: isoprenylcysteine carboxylmethyltransferase family protein [Blastocatellia bacterium]|nr:isoprenylcysteine carboxylmethyltransferase family protein [Blastocatellia bacterium]
MSTNEQTINQNWRTRLQRIRVPLGLITAIFFTLAADPTSLSLMIGVPIALGGALIRAWASGHLRKNAELAIGGPYAHTRNPLYFGSFLMVIGCAVCGGNRWLALWLIGFFLLIYWPVMQAEAEHMKTLFSGAYQQWAAQVPLFIPRLTPYRSGEARRFDWQQYLRHREYRALVGLVIVLLVLILKGIKIIQ